MAKTAVDNNNDASKMFSADVVAAVLAASGTTSLSMKQYEMMSALDAVMAKSKELRARFEAGETFEPVAPASKRGM
jgi:hypothetical protein